MDSQCTIDPIYSKFNDMNHIIYIILEVDDADSTRCYFQYKDQSAWSLPVSLNCVGILFLGWISL